MTETVERKRTTRSRKSSLSTVEKDIKAMNAYAKKISASKKESIAFLQRAGIVDKNGQLIKRCQD